VRTVLFHGTAGEDDGGVPRIERSANLRPRHALELQRRVVSHAFSLDLTNPR
jgi:hypothetical protein